MRAGNLPGISTRPGKLCSQIRSTENGDLQENGDPRQSAQIGFGHSLRTKSFIGFRLVGGEISSRRLETFGFIARGRRGNIRRCWPFGIAIRIRRRKRHQGGRTFRIRPDPRRRRPKVRNRWEIALVRAFPGCLGSDKCSPRHTLANRTGCEFIRGIPHLDSAKERERKFFARRMMRQNPDGRLTAVVAEGRAPKLQIRL